MHLPGVLYLLDAWQGKGQGKEGTEVMPEHTPGDWQAGSWVDDPHEGGSWIEVRAGNKGALIARVRQSRADADLIAAAPDLLKACEQARRRFAEQNGNVSERVWNENYEAVTALDVAFAKARGE
jgi:hypothetical protein